MCAAVLVVAAYLCGSLPTGLWFGRWAGIDVRRSGSGNVGATNVARTAGLWPGILTLLSDIAKGFFPVVLARALVTDQWLIAAIGLAAFFGHTFSVLLRFGGGKGVATGFGIFLGMAPAAAACAAVIFAAVAVTTRYVSLASVTAATALPLVTAALGSAWPVCSAALITDLVVIVRHRQNLSRLLHGIEPRFQVRK
jgi:acyl phosphate:glycerol-3-phosphate acyltransferase